MNIKCSYDELVELHKLVPHPKNPNKHPDSQITRLSKIIDFQGQRHPIIVSKNSGFIVAGHGRLQAIARLGWDKVAVNYQEFTDEAQEYSFVVSDNAVALWAELDLGSINADMIDYGPDLDIDLLGIEDFVLDLNDQDGFSDEKYTRKVESPIYQPTGAKPTIAQMMDNSKTLELISQIKESSISSDVKDFLIYAAQRHTKFNYKQIAEYYAHASKEEQILMENSALVIIDFNKAIELGFVELNENIKKAYAQN